MNKQDKERKREIHLLLDLNYIENKYIIQNKANDCNNLSLANKNEFY